jgi:tRNA (mo5U34)-methyltransferase
MNRVSAPSSRMTPEDVKRNIDRLGKWFQNMDLLGVPTAPDHFLGDYPSTKWSRFQHAIPADLTGKSVLDIGCNAGFYSVQMKLRGASRVLGIDFDSDYLAQARFVAQVSDLDIEFRQLSVYDIASLRERFDIVLFLGVLYHLRHPLLALDLIHEHVTLDTLVFQSMQRGSTETVEIAPDYDFLDTEIFNNPAFPQMYFIENSYSRDPTNWWIPNRACAEAMLRSAGFEIADRPEDEVYICKRRHVRG